jgi:hypothetical protein
LLHALVWLGINERAVFRYQGARFRLYDTTLTHLMFFHPTRWHGAIDLALLRQLLRPGDTIVDIGANVGSHAIPLAKSLGAIKPGACLRAAPARVRAVAGERAAQPPAEPAPV